MTTPTLPCPTCGRGLRRAGYNENSAALYWRCVTCVTRHKTDRQLNFLEIRKSRAEHQCPKCSSALRQSGSDATRQWYVCSNKACDARYRCDDGKTMTPTRPAQRPACPKCQKHTWEFRKKRDTLGGRGKCLDPECGHTASFDDEGNLRTKRGQKEKGTRIVRTPAEPKPKRVVAPATEKPAKPVKPKKAAVPENPAMCDAAVETNKQRASARRRLEDMRDERLAGKDLW